MHFTHEYLLQLINSLYIYFIHLQISRLPEKEVEGDEEPADTEKSLKMKLCLYLESLFASMEVGIPI